MDVRIDGRPAGQAPLVVELASGRHSVAVEGVEKTVDLSPGEDRRLIIDL